jgi:hypothetical protein
MFRALVVFLGSLVTSLAVSHPLPTVVSHATPTLCSWAPAELLTDAQFAIDNVHTWTEPEQQTANEPRNCSTVESVIRFDEVNDPLVIFNNSVGGCPAGTGQLCSSGGPSGGQARERHELEANNGFIKACWFEAFTHCEGAPQFARTVERSDSITTLITLDELCDKELGILWDPQGRAKLNSRGLAMAKIEAEFDVRVVVTDMNGPSEANFRQTLKAESSWTAAAQYGWSLELSTPPVGGAIGSTSTPPVTTAGIVDREFRSVPPPGISGGSPQGYTTILTSVQSTVGLGYIAMGHMAETRGSYAQGGITSHRLGLSIILEGGDDWQDKASSSWHKDHYRLSAYKEHFCDPEFAPGCNDL